MIPELRIAVEVSRRFRHPDDLRIPLGELKQRYDEETWGAFKAMAEREKVSLGAGEPVSVWEWLNGNKLTSSASTNPPPALPGESQLAGRLQATGFKTEILDAARKIPPDWMDAMMIDVPDLDSFEKAFLKRGFTAQQAERFAVLVGDTWEVEGNSVIVRNDHGVEEARIPISDLEH